MRRAAGTVLRAAAGLAVVAALAGTGVQLIQVAGGQSSGTSPKKTSTAPAEPPPKSLTFEPNPLRVSGLAPGVSLDRTVLVHNPNRQDVLLQSVDVSMGAPSPAPLPGLPCTSPADIQVVLSPEVPRRIAKNSSQVVPVVVRMNNTATNQDGCKDKTFPFTLTATATSK